MANHPNRGRYIGPYLARIGGAQWSYGPEVQFATIREARAWAEKWGTMADWCEILNARGRIIAGHRRDPNGDGTRWFHSTI